ncbi:MULTISPECIES: caspase family protein [unclassified Streptomyces]|uniref:caspase family protein n=1 Tax=unclassified Streptomyces TaxID=2593676 RepID=UPI00225BA20A|nr:MULTISPECIES: caspase family protein [unclassified Streptomyces]MCX4408464.1 substrate-binding domain-containing protein [Streptomyces sp. NBC_01764]MCX5185709.1 substrate-binding domain-containing protein [Streptomyces sp. NBC_00268]
MDRFDPRGKVNRALLVGVSEYEFTRPKHRDGVPGQLPAVAHNLALLVRALERGGVVRPLEITVARSPRLADFRHSLRAAADAAEGLLLLYFAGHGAVPSAGDELWLQMRDAEVVRGETAGFEGAARFTNVLRILANSHAERIVVVLDCCNAGNAARVWEAVERPDVRRRVSVLMSVQANNRIDAGDADTPTPFTAQLVELLTSGIEGQGDEVHFLDLAEALRAHMSTHHRTERGERWEPQSRTENPPVDVVLGIRAGAGRPVGPGTALRQPAPGTVGTGVVSRPTSGRRRQRALGALRSRRFLTTAKAKASVARVRAVAARLRPGSVSPSALRPTTPDPNRPSGRPPGGPPPRRLVAVLLVLAAALGLVGYFVVGNAASDRSTCAPPVELRLLTDPDLESTVRKAADTYLTSAANTTGGGCRRSGITVYGAGSAAVVAGLRDQSDPWQRPVSDDTDPQRDIGPQPDIWIPATLATATRARPSGVARTYVTLEPDAAPFAYSPMVLSLPQDIAEDSAGDRTGDSLAGLRAKLARRDKTASVRRPDPEYTDSALLATVGLYGAGKADVGRAEESVAPTGPPAPTAGDLLCTLPDNADTDRSTGALVPEFLMVSGVGCDRTTRTPRRAEYPDDVPGLDPTFVRVRWKDGDNDEAARDDAVQRFHDWLTGTGDTGGKNDGDENGDERGDESGKEADNGLAVFGQDGFRAPSGTHAFLAAHDSADGLITDPGPPAVAARAEAMDTALNQYRNANGPGRVLFLLDSSGSMAGLWQGPGGAPGILKQSLGGLGTQDEYGVWSVASPGHSPYTELLSFGPHKRQDAERALDGAAVKDAEADPYAALKAALETMDRKGRDDDRPELIVFLTDDEDNNHLTAKGHLDELLASPRIQDVPVVMAALDSGGCAKGRPDQRISDVSGGRCLDTKGDLVAGLRDEVARTGTGDE